MSLEYFVTHVLQFKYCSLMNVPHCGDFELNTRLTWDTFRFQDVLNNSDHQAVLQLTNLIAGRYFFTLEVKMKKD